MKLPFNQEQFLQVFKNYNDAVFPFQVALYIMAIGALFLARKKMMKSSKIISIILAFFWLWMGLVYHLIFFTAINKAAYLFSALFITEAFLFLLYGVRQNRLEFRFQANGFGIIAAVLSAYALIIYPLIGYLNGRFYPSCPTFGLPCPATIFTFSLLIMLDKRMPFLLLVIPVLWSFIGFTAALNLNIVEDTGLLVAGLLTVVIVFLQNRNLSHHKIALYKPAK